MINAALRDADGCAGGLAHKTPLGAIHHTFNHRPCSLVRAPAEGSFGPAIHLCVWNTWLAADGDADGYTIFIRCGRLR